MQITTIKVQGPEGEVEIARTPEGAKVMAGERLVCTIRRGEDRTHRWAEIQPKWVVLYCAAHHW